MNKIGEECGIFGIYDPKGRCADTTYYGLLSLQHRGQDGCGIAVNLNREITHYKDLGLVDEVFDEERLAQLKGTMAVGHVRYAVRHSSKEVNIRENVQPLVLRYVKGTLAIAHNGSLINTDGIRKEFERTGAIFQTTTDTELIAYMVARERVNSASIQEALSKALKKLQGAYSLLVMSPQKLIAARDPWGFRPLCMGRKGDAYIFASESCAFDSIDAEYIREIEPGEIVVVENGNVTCIKDNCREKSSLCVFEHIYFARPDSDISGQNVYESRKKAGMLLAAQSPVDADVVVGVPDSGIGAAAGYAEFSGIKNENGFIKNRYIGRTFIKPNQESREIAVKMKLNPLKGILKGKRVVMVDDSIVRGTTCGKIVKMLREAGASEVHVRISSPPFLWPCYFGTDIPSTDELIATNNSVDDIRRIIGADSLDFLSFENVHKICEDSKVGFCYGCFTGEYPIKL